MRILPFGTTEKGEPADLIELKNRHGMKVTLLSYGASVYAIEIPVTSERSIDVALGYRFISRYEHNRECMGSTVGRVANRIAGAAFTLNGVTYNLTPDQKPGNPSLHSFPNGYSERVFDYRLFEQGGEESVCFTLESPHMDQGYPGNLTFSATYTLTDDNRLLLRYEAKTDRDTLFAPTNHMYLNLNGHDSGNVLGHRLFIDALRSPVYDDRLCPTGGMRSVSGTPYDFGTEKPVGRDLFTNDGDRMVTGYDLAYEVNGGEVKENTAFVASLTGDKTGISMKLYTNMPSVQLYAAETLAVREGKGGAIYGNYGGICLEPGFIPNAIRTDSYLKPILTPEKPAVYLLDYRFFYGVD